MIDNNGAGDMGTETLKVRVTRTQQTIVEVDAYESTDAALDHAVEFHRDTPSEWWDTVDVGAEVIR